MNIIYSNMMQWCTIIDEMPFGFKPKTITLVIYVSPLGNNILEKGHIACLYYNIDSPIATCWLRYFSTQDGWVVTIIDFWEQA